MTKKFLISGVPKNGFYRCGRHFPASGADVLETDFTAEEWQRLHDEPKLRIEPIAPDAEAAQTALDRKAILAEAIAQLAPADFGQDGKPKTTALNRQIAALTDGKGDKVTATERDEAWDAVSAPEGATAAE